MHANLEAQHVHRVYDQIAPHFARTRHKPWPRVTRFLQELADGALVLDVGCANGKYFGANARIAMIGCDRSRALLHTCRQSGAHVFVADCVQLSVRAAFDAVICIAVLHHLSTAERRLTALQAIVDALVVGGKALVYVWAFEQTRHGKASLYLTKEAPVSDVRTCDLCVHHNRSAFKEQDVLVPWKCANQELLRYYHVFREGELEHIVHALANAKLTDSYYEEGNWCAVIERVDHS